jgi:Methyltransferase FkbM domain
MDLAGQRAGTSPRTVAPDLTPVRRRSWKRLLVTSALLLATGAGSGYLGYRTGEMNTYYMFFAEITDRDERAKAVLKSLFGREDFHGLYGQDLWLLKHVYPGVKDGYFVDLGAADGIDDSNSKLLETAGWNGICIDPFPSSMDQRTCTVFKEVVDSEAGRQVRFQQPGSFSGGIIDYAGWWVGEKERSTSVELTTTTLADILDRAHARSFINYMSVDIEGAEYEALRVFPFERYKVGALTVEHNNMPERRAKLRELLEGKGYRLERAILDQDWYLLEEVHPERRG